MLLESLYIDAMRGMTDVRLDQLAPLTVVVGANNAGKSSVLEAAALLMRPLDPSQWVQVARQRDFDAAMVDGLWSLFPSGPPLHLDDGPKQSSPLSLGGLLAGSERRLRASGLASLNWDASEAGELTLRVEARVNNLPVHDMTFRRDEPAEFGRGVEFYRCFTVTPATHRSTRILVEYLSRVVDTGNKALAVELLQVFDDQVQTLDVSASRGRDGVRVTHAKRGIVDLASFGDGMRRSAALALALTRASDGLLLIDELEAAIHPRALPDVIERLLAAAQKARVQILATTHSLEALDAVSEAVRGNEAVGALYYLRRTNEGHEVRRYGGGHMIELRASGLDLR